MPHRAAAWTRGELPLAPVQLTKPVVAHVTCGPLAVQHYDANGHAPVIFADFLQPVDPHRVSFAPSLVGQLLRCPENGSPWERRALERWEVFCGMTLNLGVISTRFRAWGMSPPPAVTHTAHQAVRAWATSLVNGSIDRCP